MAKYGPGDKVRDPWYGTVYTIQTVDDYYYNCIDEDGLFGSLDIATVDSQYWLVSKSSSVVKWVVGAGVLATGLIVVAGAVSRKK
jgi:hypothetical protein